MVKVVACLKKNCIFFLKYFSRLGTVFHRLVNNVDSFNLYLRYFDKLFGATRCPLIQKSKSHILSRKGLKIPHNFWYIKRIPQ